jgi:hypothetical protein
MENELLVRRLFFSLTVCTFWVWVCLDSSLGFEDYSTTSGLLGPGSFLGWAINTFDYFFDELLYEIKDPPTIWRKDTSISLWPPPITTTHTNRTTIQALFVYGYPLASFINATMSLRHSLEIVYAQFEHCILTWHMFLGLSISSRVRLQGITWVFLSFTSQLLIRKTPQQAESEEAIIQVASYVTIAILYIQCALSICCVNRRIWTFVLGFQSTFLLCLCLGIGNTLLFQNLVLHRVKMRPPWPRSPQSLSELDQAFAFALAIAYFVVGRQKQLFLMMKDLPNFIRATSQEEPSNQQEESSDQQKELSNQQEESSSQQEESSNQRRPDDIGDISWLRTLNENKESNIVSRGVQRRRTDAQ